MKKIILISVVLLLVSFLPIFILGEKSYITVHDNLDSEFVFYHILKLTENLFPFSNSKVVPNIFDGLSTNYFHSEFSFIRVLFYMFPSFWAYVLNSLIIRIIGIFGLSLLIKDYFKSSKYSTSLIVLIVISFALLPVYSLYGISVLGQPILLWSFMNLKHKKKLFISFLIILMFPFYAHFALIAPFLLFALFIYGVIGLKIDKKISISYFIGLGVLCISFALANYYTIENFIFNEMPSHRVDWIRKIPSISSTIKTFLHTILESIYHSSLVFGLPVFLLAIYAILKKTTKWKTIGLVIISILVIGFFHSIYNFISVPLEDKLHILTSFQFNRFTFLLPFLYYILILLFYCDSKISSRLLWIVVILFCLRNISYNSELKYNVTKLVLPQVLPDEVSSFETFYSEDLFQDIKKHIGLPQREYKVVSLGICPSIAQYNGFYTLDSYQNNYPLSYKKRFREVIKSELYKNAELKEYFDDWGSRCYLFSAELKKSCYINCTKDYNAKVKELSINTDALKEIGCVFIFSAVLIENADDINLRLDKTFENNNSKLKIYLYKL